MIRAKVVKQKKKKAKAVALSEEESRAKKKLLKKKLAKEVSSCIKELVLEVDSKRTASVSFDAALEEAFEQASAETSRMEEEQPSQP